MATEYESSAIEVAAAPVGMGGDGDPPANGCAVVARSPMRWWGWGDPEHPATLPPHALAHLRASVGVAERPRPPVALESVGLPPSRIDVRTRERLVEILGPSHLREARHERVLHAAGRGYPDLLALRSGRLDGAPDAVLYPGSREQLRRLLDACSECSLAVVPFGGGTSVVGGVASVRGPHAGVVALDMSRLAGEARLDEASRTVTAGAGMRVRELERVLGERGFTLGHFPQSYEYVTLGGCAATRSAGQASTGYGRFESLVRGLRVSTPSGPIDLAALPASAAGPSLRELIVGSEGALGTIDELDLRVRVAPQRRRYEGVVFADLRSGAAALRELVQRGIAPDVARLSDREETAISLLLSGEGLRKRIADGYLRLRRRADGCLAILGFEGAEREVEHRRVQALAAVHAHGALAVGASPGRAWLRSRFAAPYLRDELLTHGVMVETLETATQWSNLLELHRRVGEAIVRALQDCGTPGIVMCHVSHLYETGASLYFTFFARQLEGQELAQWRSAKEAASAAIIAGGATITHHHAVGRDHAGWLEREIGSVGVSALRALKSELDPAGIMNPGKLLLGNC